MAQIAAADACATVPCSVHVDDASPRPVSYVVTARADGGTSAPSNVLALGAAVPDGGPGAR